MQTLAFGGSGLLWFTYWMPAGVPAQEGWKHSMILADGSRDPHYDMIKQINAGAKAIGDVLVRCESTTVFQAGKDVKVKMTTSPIVVNDADVTVGVFGDGAKKLALVTNRDYKNSAKPSAIVTNAAGTVERFDPAAKKWSDAGA